MSRLLRFALPLALLLAGCSKDLDLPPPVARGGVIGAVVLATDAGLTGVPNVTISLVANDGSKQKQDTDADGGFHFGDLAPTFYFVQVVPNGFTAPPPVPVKVLPGAPVDVGALIISYAEHAASDATIAGKVVVAGGTSGNPEGARVEFTVKATQRKVAVATVGADGSFVGRVPAGVYELQASHPLYVTSTPREVSVAEAEYKDLTAAPIQLDLNPATLAGHIIREVDGQATPAAAAGVRVTLDTGDTTDTDSTGNFSLGGLRGGAHTFRLGLADHVDPLPVHAVTLTPGQTTTVDAATLALKLHRVELRGTVSLADHQPAIDVTVSVSGTGYSAVATQDTAQPWVGSFRIANVPNGVYEVAATKARYSRAVVGSVQATDAADTVSVGALTLTLLQGDFRIDDGDPTNADGTSRTRQVSLDLAGLSNVSQVKAADGDTAFAAASYAPFTGSKLPLTLEDRQGTHVVFLQYLDGSGTPSAKLSATVVLDTVAPTNPRVLINGGQGFTNQKTSLALTITAAEDRPSGVDAVSGLARMKVSLAPPSTADGGVTLGGTSSAYQRDSLFALPQPQADGPVAVWVQVVDAAGNGSDPTLAQAQATVVIDTQPPQGLAVSIADGASALATGFTNSALVNLSLGAAAEPNGGSVLVKVANSTQALQTAMFQPVSSLVPFGLDATGADGARTVYALFRDAAGNEALPQTASITLDRTPPGPVSASLVGSSPTRQTTVTLQLSATDTFGLAPDAGVAVSEDPLFSWGTVGPMALPANGQVSVPLSAGDGPKVVLARFTDKAGNVSSASVRLVLDTTPPRVAFTLTGKLADGTPSTTLTAVSTVDVAVDAPEGVDWFAGTEALATCPTAGYQALPVPAGLALASSATPRVVRLCVRDLAGNVAGPVEETITFDNQPPAGCSLALSGTRADGSPAPDGGTASPVVSARVTCTGEAPKEIVLVAGAVTCSATAALPWQPIQAPATLPVLLAGTEGLNAVNGCVRDAARNATAVTGAQIVLDTTPPQAPVLVLDDGAPFVNAGQVAARGGPKVTAAGAAAGASAWAVQGSVDFSAAAWQSWPLGSPTTFTFPDAGVLAPDAGRQTLYAAFKDELGNVSAVASAGITFDVTPPAPGALALVTPSGTSSTNTVSVSLVVTAPPDAVSMQVVEGAPGCPAGTFAGVAARPVAPSLTFVLSGAQGAKTVCAQFLDAAGNVSSPPASATATLDTVAPTLTTDVRVGGVLNPSATNQAAVTLELTVSADVTFAAASASPQQCAQLPATAWTAVASSPATLPYTLTGTGNPAASQSIFVCVKDQAGNTASSATSIVFDTVAPSGVVTVGSGQAIQTGATLSVTLSGVSADVTRMMVVKDATPSCATLPGSYVPFSATSALPVTDGAHTVSVCLADAANNFVALAPVTVTVDNAAPTTGAVTLTGLTNQAAGVTRSTALTVSVAAVADATSGVDSVRLASDSTFAGVPFGLLLPDAGVVAGTLNLPWALPSGDGTKTVWVQLKDRAGLVSAPAQAQTVLDTTPPVWLSTPTAAKLYVKTNAVSITYAASDNLDATANLQVGFSTTGTCAGASYSAYGSGTQSFSGLAAGWNSIVACVKDRAGNETLFPSAMTVNLDTTAPLASNLVPNPPVGLGSGALVSWADSNPDTEHVEVDASMDPTFATGVVTNKAAVGTCSLLGVTRPPSSTRVGLSGGDPLLTNLVNWYFRLRAVDCAGNSTANVPVPGSAVPNVGSAPLDTLAAAPAVFADGPDLWVHAAQNVAAGSGVTPKRQEVLLHCRAANQDCRDRANWRRTAVVIDDPAQNMVANDPGAAPASMFATDDTLYLVDTVTDTNNGNGSRTLKLAMAWCDRATDCDAAGNWKPNTFVRQELDTGAMARPSAAVSGAALGVFVVLKQAAYGSAPYLSMARCDRALGKKCRDGLNWTSVDTPILLDPAAPLTATGTDDRFYIGGVSLQAYGTGTLSPDAGPLPSQSITGPGQPVLINCEHACSLGGNPDAGCTGGTSWPAQVASPACGCDGYVCGDFRFSSFDTPAGGTALKATAPRILSGAGMLYSAWTTRSCVAPNSQPCTDTIRAARCNGTACAYSSDFTRTTISSRAAAANASLGTALPPFVFSIAGGLQGPSVTARLAWTDLANPALMVSSCSGAGCFTTMTSATVAAGPGTESAVVGDVVGKDLYLVGSTSLGTPMLYQPVVQTPPDFLAATQAGTLYSRWSPISTATGTRLSYGPADGGSSGATTVLLGDPFTTTFSVPLSAGSALRASARAEAAGGVSDPTAAWSASPFLAAPSRTDLQSNMAVSLASPGPAQTSSSPFVFASYLSPTTGLALGRCTSTLDCSSGVNWSWGQANVNTLWNTNQVTVDYPREFPHAYVQPNLTSASTPRLFTGGRWNGSSLYIESCLVTGPTACQSPADFQNQLFSGTGTLPALSPVAQPVLRAAGDLVQTVETDGNNNVIVRFCDGSATYPHDVCAGPGPTNRPLDYCFNPANWKSVTLPGFTSQGAWGTTGLQIGGAPHPNYGFTAVQPRANGGFAFWACSAATYGGGCSTVQNDCTNVANWRMVLVDTGSVALYPDLVVSQQNYNPTANVNDYTTGVYVSFFDTGANQWSVAQCRGAPDPLFVADSWSCIQKGVDLGGGRFAGKGWSYAPVMAGAVTHAVSSTIRVINGDLVAAFMEDNRLQVASCPGGINCHRTAGWHAFTLTGAFATDVSAATGSLTGGFGALAAGLGNDMYVVYPNLSGATRSVNFLVGGRFSAQ